MNIKTISTNWGQTSIGQFHGGGFSDYDSNFTGEQFSGHNLNSVFQTKINATSSVE